MPHMNIMHPSYRIISAKLPDGQQIKSELNNMEWCTSGAAVWNALCFSVDMYCTVRRYSISMMEDGIPGIPEMPRIRNLRNKALEVIF